MNTFIKQTSRRILVILWLSNPLYAQEVAKWEGEMAAFQEADRIHPPAKGGIVFTGSSSIRLWQNLQEHFPKRNVINRGFGGSELEDVIALVDQVIFPYQPRQVVLYAGDNDIANGKTADEVADDFRLLFRKIRSRLPSASIVFISIKPSPSRIQYLEEVQKANQLIKKFLKGERNADYADVYSAMVNAEGKPQPDFFLEDNLHMNAKGYEQWAKVLKPYLLKQ